MVQNIEVDRANRNGCLAIKDVTSVTNARDFYRLFLLFHFCGFWLQILSAFDRTS